MLEKLKYLIKKNLYSYTLDKHKSTMFINQARKYSGHLKYCQQKSKINSISNSKIIKFSKEFIKKGNASFITDEYIF